MTEPFVSSCGGLEARPDGGRFGVYARRAFAAGEVVERAPVIVIPGDAWDAIARTVLDNYVIAWGERDAAVALGFGSLYAHSDTPTAIAVPRPEMESLDIVALDDIAVGQEITLDYTQDS
jgi:hypothetical protein